MSGSQFGRVVHMEERPDDYLEISEKMIPVCSTDRFMRFELPLEEFDPDVPIRRPFPKHRGRVIDVVIPQLKQGLPDSWT